MRRLRLALDIAKYFRLTHERPDKMNFESELSGLLAELNRVHRGEISWGDEFEMPDFVTSDTGVQIHFTKVARLSLRNISRLIYSNRSPNAAKIESPNHEKVTRQVLADMYASGQILLSNPVEAKNTVALLKTAAEKRISQISQEFTHYFPAWTLGVERIEPFSLGSVTFLTRAQWIASVDFPAQGKDNYASAPEENHRWKEIVTNALESPDKAEVTGLASTIFDAIKKCPSVLKVSISGYEKEYSKKLALIVCKTSLDAVSLLFGGADVFMQQVLLEERLPPINSYSLLETGGHLWLPGSRLSKQIPGISPTAASKALKDSPEIILSISKIIHSLTNTETHQHPNLANRWATALDWYGEGCRESSDAIALAKIASSLDVLACGGKSGGISQMLQNLFKISGETIVVNGPTTRTLDQLVKEIYEGGRSKILHGTHFDRLKSFELQRQQASHLARAALLEAAVRLIKFTGTDDEKAFRSMQK